MRIICENYLKILIFLVFFLNFIPCTNAETGYISPESYAVNEADLNDYMDIAPSPKLKIDDLDKPFTQQDRIRELQKEKARIDSELDLDKQENTRSVEKTNEDEMER